MSFSISFLSAALISFLLTGLFRRLGIKYGIVSTPRERDVHKKPMPRIGGVAIFAAFLIVSMVYFLFFDKHLSALRADFGGNDVKIWGIWAGAALITVSMLFDDLFTLKASSKFFFQIAAVIVLIASGVGINTLTNPFGQPINLNSIYIPLATLHGITYHFSLWSDLLTLVWMVGMMNVLNFIDGIDGLAAGTTLIAAFTIFLLSISTVVSQPSVALIAIILAGASSGFLIWNFPPAKIFMGDAGSMFLGFMLGALPLLSGGKLATVFLVLGFPIVDGLVVAGSRIIRGKNPFTTPDKTHLHHRFIAAGFSVRQSLIFLYMIAVLFAWVALRSTTMNKLIAAGVLVLLLIAVILFLKSRAKKLLNC